MRRVAAAEIPDEVARVAGENGLAAVAEGETPPPLPRERPLLGVVTGVDERANVARVAFAPGVRAELRVEDVAWARPFDTSSAPWQIQKIATALQLGDVVRLASYQPAAQGRRARPGPRLTLDQKPEVQGALLSLDVETGEVLALVGGYDFEASQFDRAVQARAPAGLRRSSPSSTPPPSAAAGRRPRSSTTARS